MLIAILAHFQFDDYQSITIALACPRGNAPFIAWDYYWFPI